MTTFWSWLWCGGEKSRAGIFNILNKFLLVHVLVGLVASWLINSDPFAFAQKALFPAASIFIGMSMAWTTRASTILQSEELRAALFRGDRSAEDYIYGFQLAILVVILMVALVAIMAGGGLNIVVLGGSKDIFLSGFWLYLMLSLSLRECWGVVNFTNMLSLLEYRRSD